MRTAVAACNSVRRRAAGDLCVGALEIQVVLVAKAIAVYLPILILEVRLAARDQLHTGR